jgi:predicted nuclease of predicted toxin-antitoxin system
MRFLLDMNLSPDWIDEFVNRGYEAVHWSTIGAANATDASIMAFARENRYIVFTHDLDFGAMIAATEASFPSVIQVRIQDVSPQSLSVRFFKIVEQYSHQLEEGALIVVDSRKSRVRILPLRPKQ